MRDVLRLIRRALLLALALGLVGTPPLQAQEDDDGATAGQSVDLPRGQQEQAGESGSDSGEESQFQESQGQGESEPTSDGGGGTETGDGGQADYSGDRTGAFPAGDPAAGADGTSAPGGSGRAGPGSAQGGSGQAGAAGSGSDAGGAARAPGPFPSVPPTLAIALVAAAAAGAALLAAKLLMPWPQPKLRCACDVSPPSLAGGGLTLQPPDVTVSAESALGTPTIAGDIAIEQGEQRGE